MKTDKTWNDAIDKAIKIVAAHFPDKENASGLCVDALNYELAAICSELTATKKNLETKTKE